MKVQLKDCQPGDQVRIDKSYFSYGSIDMSGEESIVCTVIRQNDESDRDWYDTLLGWYEGETAPKNADSPDDFVKFDDKVLMRTGKFVKAMWLSHSAPCKLVRSMATISYATQTHNSLIQQAMET